MIIKTLDNYFVQSLFFELCEQLIVINNHFKVFKQKIYLLLAN